VEIDQMNAARISASAPSVSIGAFAQERMASQATHSGDPDQQRPPPAAQ